MPDLTVVIPVEQGSSFLIHVLRALGEQTYLGSAFDVIVVTDRSLDFQIAPGLADELPYALRVISQDGHGVSRALNQGAQAATGWYCLFLCDDAIPRPELISEHLAAQKAGRQVIGIGPVLAAEDSRTGPFSSWYAAGKNQRESQLSIAPETVARSDCSYDNLCVVRDSFLSAGGLVKDVPYLGGLEFAHRLLGMGYDLRYVPGAVVQKQVSQTYDDVASQAEARGAESVTLYARTPDILVHLPLGTFHDTSVRGVALRRCMLRIPVPARGLQLVGTGLRARRWQSEWYTFVHGYHYWLGVRRAVSDIDTWRRLTQSVPILMYHAFGGTEERASRYVTPAHRFERQLRWLNRLGFTVISLQDFVQWHREFRLPPARSVVLTIDDGYADNREIALPILLRHSCTATIFVVTGMVGSTNAWDQEGELAGRPLLSWCDVRAMYAQGLHFGAHTRSHVSVSRVPVDRADEEITISRTALQQELGVPVMTFSYPNGAQDAVSRQLVQSAGFDGACCSWSGLNPLSAPLFALRRVEIRGTDSLGHFFMGIVAGRTRFSTRRPVSVDTERSVT